MPCNQENNALLYAYGELEDSETAAFVEHLKNCKECQKILHTCALATASLRPHKAPEFVMPAQDTVNEKEQNYGFLGFFKRWAYPALVFGTFALILGFTAFEFSAKKPMASIRQEVTFDIDEMDADLTDLETEISEMFQYMQEI